MQRQRTAVYVPFFLLALAMFLASCDEENFSRTTTTPPQPVPTIHKGVPRFEPTACQQQLNPGSTTQCGFLVVPENRSKSNDKTIKLYITIL